MNINDIEKRMHEGISHGLFQKSIYACEEVFNIFKRSERIKKSDEFILFFQ